MDYKTPEDFAKEETEFMDKMQAEWNAMWRHKKRWIIVEEGDGTYSVHEHMTDGVAPPITKPNKREAAARLLQIMQIGPVAPQDFPEDVCVGEIGYAPAEVLNITRKDEGAAVARCLEKSPAKYDSPTLQAIHEAMEPRSEISDIKTDTVAGLEMFCNQLGADEQAKFCVSHIREGYEVVMLFRGYRRFALCTHENDADVIAEAMNNRHSKPVLVSLDAHRRMLQAVYQDQKSNWQDIARASLDAAGVKYVE